MRQTHLGIIGLGNEGKLILNNCLRLGEAKIDAVADLSEKARNSAKRMGVKNVYEKYEDMLKQETIDGVIISLPNFLHEEATVKCAESGKHILLEKPLARNVDEGERILSAAKKNSVKLMVGFEMHFDRYRIVRYLFGVVLAIFSGSISQGRLIIISC